MTVSAAQAAELRHPLKSFRLGLKARVGFRRVPGRETSLSGSRMVQKENLNRTVNVRSCGNSGVRLSGLS